MAATITDAIVHYCRAGHCDPEETLDTAFPVLEELIRAHVLALEGGVAAASQTAKIPASAFRKVKRAAANRFSPRERLLGHYIRRLDPAGALFEAVLPEPPHASINYGSGGVANFFYRLACIRDDAQLLSWAKLWIEKAF